MKPNFALDLSHEGISLYRRGRKEWLLVGVVALDDPEMADALAMLRRTATGLDKAGISTQLIIPASQILHKEIHAPGPDRDAGIKAALIGATPYDVDDLVYDFTGSSEYVDVAVVARETLAEAEGFACEHDLNPVCFVASPIDTPFNREIFFGETDFAAGFLEGDVVEADQAILPFRKDKAPERSPDKPIVAEIPATEDLKPAAEDNAADDAVAAPVKDETPEQPPIPVAFSSKRGELGEAKAPYPLENVTPRFGLAETANTAVASGSAPKIEPLPSSENTSAPRLNLRPPEDNRPPPEAAAIAPPDTLATPKAAPNVPQRETNFAPVQEKPTKSGVNVGSSLVAKITKVFGGMVPAQKTPKQRASTKKSNNSSNTPAPSKGTEAEALTVFGARKAQRGDSSKLGFVLTLMLLLVLLAIAFGSSYFLSDTIARLWRSEPLIETAAPNGLELPAMNDEAAADAAEQALPDGDTQIAALTDGTAEVFEPADTGQNQTEFDPDLPAGPLSGTDAGPQTIQDAEVAYVASGIWQLAPDQAPTPGIETSDDIYVASLDPVVNSFDALALPDNLALLGDHNPAISSVPILPGLTFDFDERGFVRATPAGALTPEGVRVVAAKPPIKPPQRPEETLRDTSVATASLPNTRPKSRPSDLSDRIERGSLSGRTLAELGGLKPKPRPQSIQETATEEIDGNADNADDINSGTKLAVLASIKPTARPRDFKSTVETVLSTRVSTGSGDVAVPRSTTSNAPAIPTRASVARSATQRNALRLNAVSLLGVTGKTNAYRALVRLPSGRVLTVEVGDRLDGGRVAAIGNGTLSYVKSGRSLVLKMPSDG